MSILMKGMRQLPRIAIIAALLMVVVATPIVASAATPTGSSEESTTTPVFPSPVPWFDWGQRYVNRLAGSPYYTYLKGFGNYQPDLIIGGQPYKKNVTLDPLMRVSYTAYLKSVGNSEELHWYMRGSDNGTVATVFDGDLLNFEYPLYLGKTWIDNTTITVNPYFKLDVITEAAAVAYIQPVLDSSGSVASYNVVKAEGHSDYQLPDLNYNGVRGDDIPLPRKELGDVTWDYMRNCTEEDARIGWNDVKVPAGPCAGQNIQGYYAVQQTITTKMPGPAGYPVSRITMEAWKDVRGCVPVQIVQREQWSAAGYSTQTTTTVAKAWTGNFTWFQFEFGTPNKSFGVRVDNTAIDEGGRTFQFKTAAKDFGLKYAGDAMVVDMDNGLITIDYEDSYISCDAGMVRIHDDLWLGIARIKDLVAGRTYLVFGVTPSM